MTYSGVGKVVPSMVAVKTNASSQNATWRGAASLLRSAPSEWSRQSAQGWSGMRLGACVVAMVRIASPCDPWPNEDGDTGGIRWQGHSRRSGWQRSRATRTPLTTTMAQSGPFLIPAGGQFGYQAAEQPH